jgi:hypothetical protein
LPDELAEELEAEAKKRGVSKSDIVRGRLEQKRPDRKLPASLDHIADLIGSIDGLPEDLSARKKHYLRKWSHGRKRRR